MATGRWACCCPSPALRCRGTCSASAFGDWLLLLWTKGLLEFLEKFWGHSSAPPAILLPFLQESVLNLIPFPLLPFVCGCILWSHQDLQPPLPAPSAAEESLGSCSCPPSPHRRGTAFPLASRFASMAVSLWILCRSFFPVAAVHIFVVNFLPFLTFSAIVC